MSIDPVADIASGASQTPVQDELLFKRVVSRVIFITIFVLILFLVIQLKPSVVKYGGWIMGGPVSTPVSRLWPVFK